jgi:ribosome-binding protein aMBF1 (putative translation factor)
MNHEQPSRPAAPDPGADRPARPSGPGADPEPQSASPAPEEAGPVPLPVMPGFREMARRQLADAHAARMADDRVRLVRELAGRRQAAGLSQTEIAARMGTSQSAVARLEAGTADVRASTLERYAAAVGGQITWKLSSPEGGGASG